MALENYFWKELHKGDIVRLLEVQPGTLYLSEFSSILGVQTVVVRNGIAERDLRIYKREDLEGQAFLIMEECSSDDRGQIFMKVMHDGGIKTLFCPVSDRADWLKC